VTISKRGYYYFAGELPVGELSKEAAARGYQTAVHTAQAAQEALGLN
jgi:hypothetical protein